MESKMIKIEKADAETLAKAKRHSGKQLYPFDEMEVGDMFHASLHRYWERNGEDRTVEDMRKSIFAAAKRVAPMRFRMLKKRLDGNPDVVLGLDVVRVA
jgi:hypothetical protein